MADRERDSKGTGGELSRRGFLAAGAALGGAIVWSPSFAFGGGSDPLQACRDLREEVRDSDIGDALKRRLNVRIGRIQEAIRNENFPRACALLENLKEFLDRKRGVNGLSDRKAQKWIDEASEIQEQIGCNVVPTGPTGPTGLTGQTGLTGDTGP